ncbi:hypothetical protein A8B98_16275 [Hymenobacter sp. UV11]|nr:hypothetical protein A8B98_16275 [Hymenobacter sp. UV11]
MHSAASTTEFTTQYIHRRNSYLKQTGCLQGEFDRLIGSVAVAHGLTLVTHNTRHFTDRIGIGLEDWVQKYEDGQ